MDLPVQEIDVPVDEDFDPEKRARLIAAIDDGIEDFERGDHMDGFDLLAQMRVKCEAAGRSAPTN